ncbi:SpoIIE family protein phosphatase [Streptomyces sp. NPDC059169]|uniref:SpoIIE family protein phosphatase n=1 Tax=unclassified Streptomyces TaxID=2593676 RepID=UPI00368CB46B
MDRLPASPGERPGAAQPPAGPAGAGAGTGFGEWAFVQSPCALAVFGADLRLVRANAGMELLLSRTEDEVLGLRWAHIVPDRRGEAVERGMRQVLDTGEPQSLDVPVPPVGRGAGGAGKWSGSVGVVRDGEGRPCGVCLAVHPRPTAEQRPPAPGGTGTGTSSAIGGSNVAEGARELADRFVPGLADVAVVDLLEQPWEAPTDGGGGRPHADTAAGSGPGSALDGSGAPGAARGGVGGGVVGLRRMGVRCAPEVGGEAVLLAGLGQEAVCPAWSPVAACLGTRQGIVCDAAGPTVVRWVGMDSQAAWITGTGIRSLLLVPLLAGGMTLGIAVLGRSRTRPFAHEEVERAAEIAGRAAAGIHAARRRARDRTSTMTLQRSLLPQTLPDQAALEIATRYLPAGGPAGIGGDWFDVIPLSGARIALVVGDVVGHGIRASATMGRLRTAVRTLADVDLPPDELLTHLDDLVIHLSADETTTTGSDTASGIGTTCLYAVYDPITRRCTLARAGHPPPIVVTPDNDAYFLDVPPGPPLGLGGLPFETAETELPEGSLLALYTDGLLQTRERDIDEALDTLFAALTHPSTTLDTVCDRVLTRLLTHPPDDDIALLIGRTRTLPSHNVATWELSPDPAIVAQARQHTTRQLTAWGLDHAVFTTELIVSELVTNAIRYGHPPIHLRLIHDHATLISEVFDSSNTTPHLRRARTYDEGGRGLLLVAQLTERWGTRHTPTGKTIWAEQTLAPM